MSDKDDARRKRVLKRKPDYSRIGESRKRWARLDGQEAIHYEVAEATMEDGEGSLEGWGSSHFLMLQMTRAGSKVTLNLSEMTEEEILAFKKVIDAAMAEAIEVCRLRDNRAREAFENGDDGFTRLYRQVPKLVDRSRKE